MGNFSRLSSFWVKKAPHWCFQVSVWTQSTLWLSSVSSFKVLEMEHWLLVWMEGEGGFHSQQQFWLLLKGSLRAERFGKIMKNNPNGWEIKHRVSYPQPPNGWRVSICLIFMFTSNSGWLTSWKIFINCGKHKKRGTHYKYQNKYSL